VKPWLLAIVRNCHLTALGQKKRHAAAPLPENDNFADADPTPEGRIMASDDGRRLNAALAKLPEEFREVVVLRELEEMSYREIADVTGTPIGTVMSRLARGRALLRVELAGDKV
jgi:RNA polymerase sigma-70 factor (ECF subfamily)